MSNSNIFIYIGQWKCILLYSNVWIQHLVYAEHSEKVSVSHAEYSSILQFQEVCFIAPVIFFLLPQQPKFLFPQCLLSLSLSSCFSCATTLLSVKCLCKSTSQYLSPPLLSSCQDTSTTLHLFMVEWLKRPQTLFFFYSGIRY